MFPEGQANITTQLQDDASTWLRSRHRDFSQELAIASPNLRRNKFLPQRIFETTRTTIRSKKMNTS
jgi:hypothetical protein